MTPRNRSNLYFAAFIFLFFLGMGCSKMLHPLWFAERQCLPIFAFSYSMMALVGAFSFIYSALADRIGISKSIKIGCILYSAGLLLRAIPNSYPAALCSSILAGVGASTFLICLRYWIGQTQDDDSRATIISFKTLATQLGFGLGAALAGWLALMSYANGLMIGGLIPLVGLIFISQLKFKNLHNEATSPKKLSALLKEIFQSDKSLLLSLIAISGIGGLYTSFIIPFMPIILSHLGLSITNIGYLIGGCAVCTCIIQLKIAKHLQGRISTEQIFLISQIALASLTLLFNIKLGTVFLVLIIISRAFASTLSALTQEMLELRMIGPMQSSIYFGVMQSSFLIGDMLGASIAGYAYSAGNQKTLIIASSALMILSALLLPVLVKRRQTQCLNLKPSAAST